MQKNEDVLYDLGACNEAMDWVGQQEESNPKISRQSLWDLCPRADWLIWLLMASANLNAAKSRINKILPLFFKKDTERRKAIIMDSPERIFDEGSDILWTYRRIQSQSKQSTKQSNFTTEFTYEFADQCRSRRVSAKAVRALFPHPPKF